MAELVAIQIMNVAGDIKTGYLVHKVYKILGSPEQLNLDFGELS